MSAASSQPEPTPLHAHTGAHASPAGPLGPGGSPQSTRRRSAPLSVVRSGPTRRRTPFVVFCFLVLAAALATVLVLNINVSSGQYRLVELRHEQTALMEQNQALAAQVEENVAPQNLARKAEDAGMVPAPAPAYIDLRDLKVSGEPKPAEKKDAPEIRVPVPAVPGGPAQSEGEQSSGGQSGAASNDAEQGSGAAGQQVDLHGGTIEAPQQKDE